jgi:hypothetical protein
LHVMKDLLESSVKMDLLYVMNQGSWMNMKETMPLMICSW